VHVVTITRYYYSVLSNISNIYCNNEQYLKIKCNQKLVFIKDIKNFFFVVIYLHYMECLREMVIKKN